MQLGTFSVSLAVKDLNASKEFYQKLGFNVMGDYPDQGWAILSNGTVVIGLFQGMFEQNILTFNPRWTSPGEGDDSMMDVREIQKRLKADGIDFIAEADETTSGPAHCILVDPDGNQIMLDQHV
ncbi:MAG: VOC family protein [Leptolyngbyaceae cyanobacterium MAG.088]|nr:VOC family protein [Leptolyngbyaceae cyanobacterium MAG.088]